MTSLTFICHVCGDLEYDAEIMACREQADGSIVMSCPECRSDIAVAPAIEEEPIVYTHQLRRLADVLASVQEAALALLDGADQQAQRDLLDMIADDAGFASHRLHRLVLQAVPDAT